MTTRPLDLYELLPAHLRASDEESGKALEGLLAIISEQVDVVKRDTDRFYDDIFIETCSPWLVPYIGELVSNTPLHASTVRARADVAKTIYYRRRKATLPMLEEVARDVTGWPGRAVAFFENLQWTQFLDHERQTAAPDPSPILPKLPPPPLPPGPGRMSWNHTGASSRVATVHLRDAESLDRIDGAFDEVAHTVDVRPPSTSEGWHNIRNIGFFLWRLESYPMEKATARPDPSGVPGTRFRFNPLGRDAPLFNLSTPEMEESELAEERHVPGPIRGVNVHLELKRIREGASPSASRWYGPGLPILVRKGPSTEVPAAEVYCKDLSAWQPPPAGKVAIDVRLGRICLPDADALTPAQSLVVDFAYGFSADMGGGPYDRSECLAQPELDPDGAATERLFVRKGVDLPAKTYPSISEAITAWGEADPDQHPPCVIEIQDSATYVENALTLPPTAKPWTRGLVIQAADQQRPHLRLGKLTDDAGEFVVQGTHPDASLRLSGLLVEGSLRLDGSLGRLEIDHCTLVPGREFNANGKPMWPKRESVLAAASNTLLRVDITSSIVGQLVIAGAADGLCIEDSIVHGLAGHAISAKGGQPGPTLRIERSTVLGRVNVRELSYASDCIFTDRVLVTRRQSGCVRYSYVDPESTTPRRYRCQPDLATAEIKDPAVRKAERVRLVPNFTSRHYGDPGYCQLAESVAREVREGAEDGSEMGAFSSLRQPQRIANLRLRLEEYLPFGLDPGVIFVT